MRCVAETLAESNPLPPRWFGCFMRAMSAQESIGFIGTGVMGAAMAGHLLAAGYRVTVYNRTKERAAALVDRGARWSPSVADVAMSSGVIITMIGTPQDVEAVYLADGGLVAGVREGALLIDMTTSSPRLAATIARAGAARGVDVLDAPVSGGDVGAREGRLSIMVGGTEAAFARAQPIFSLLGKTIIHQGPAGAGQHVKMSNQIVIASTMVAICESMAYARSAGLDVGRVLDCLQGGAAGSWALSNLAPRVLRGDFAPGFLVRHFLKDMAIALESAREMNLALPGLALSESLYQRLAQQGHAEEGTHALARLYFRG
jgi:3-hydroxyisobutyrate dehydrogenase